MPDHDIADRLFHHLRYRELREQIDAWGRLLQAKMDQIIQKQGEIMAGQNTSAQALQDAVTRLEQGIADMGTKVTTEITDFQAAVVADLTAAGVPTSVVDAVTARVNNLVTGVANITNAVVAADPGAQAPPPQA